MKENKLKATVCLLLSLLLFVSCDPLWGPGRPGDPDSDRGYILTGRWFGDLGMYVGNEPARGSVLDFVPDAYDYRYGYGTEVDYYGPAGRYTITHHFDWEIVDRCIYMYFDNPDLDCMIYDYSLSRDYFQGYIDNYGYKSRFKLWNYDRYWWDYGYGVPYAVKNDAAGSADGQSVPNENPVCKRKLGKIY